MTTTPELQLQNFKTIAEAIGTMFGTHCEVAVHDLSMPATSLVHLVNGHITGRHLGDPIRDLFYAVLPNLDGRDVLANYATGLPDGRTLKSTTCILRDADGEPAFALCVNLDVSKFAEAKAVLDELVSVEERSLASSDDPWDGNVHELLRSLVHNTAQQFGKNLRDLSVSERLAAVKFLDGKGAFLIKGCVPLVAEVLGISEPSVYRYLDQAREMEGADN